MRKYLLPMHGKSYKANLHCHTNISDGKWTPEEVKERYKDNGYSIVAFTDHDVFVTHNDLRDETFLPLNGYELEFCPPQDGHRRTKLCHVCFVSLDENKSVQKIFYKSKFFEKNPNAFVLDTDCDYIDPEYSPNVISDVIMRGVEEGFFVTYNHPTWSLETLDEYRNYHGMNAMEIVNYGCVVDGYDDHNGKVYDEMLRGGEKIYCIAADDNHNYAPIDSPGCDSFGAFTMIKAEKLTYSSISKALLNGDFYASEGPEIKDLYIEDGRVYIATSDVVRIAMITDGKCKTKAAEKKGDTITFASFSFYPEKMDYMRFVVYDKNNKCAYSNAFFFSKI